MVARRRVHQHFASTAIQSAILQWQSWSVCIAIKQVLDGTISEKGILWPKNSMINDPLMAEPKKYGITMVEKTLA